MNATFISEGYVGDQHRQKLESGDELIVAAEAGMEIATIKSLPVIKIAQPFNGTGWDTHEFGQLKQHILIKELDDALTTLVLDLEERRMLDKTLIVVATEFGRPADFDVNGGRSHQSTTFTMVLAGGGLNHCGAFGETDELSKQPVADAVSVPDFHATIHAALGIDPSEELYDGDRPVPITDRGRPIGKLLSRGRSGRF